MTKYTSRAIESSGRARLTPESLPQVRRACLFSGQYLDGHVPIEIQLVRQVHGARAAATQQSFDRLTLRRWAKQHLVADEIEDLAYRNRNLQRSTLEKFPALHAADHENASDAGCSLPRAA